METYKLKVYCTNCNFKGEIEIQKGVAYSNQECLNCGVADLKFVQEPAIMTMKKINYL